MLIDSHCHINDERLISEADTIVENLENDGLESVICVGYDRPSSSLAVQLSDKYDKVYAAVGMHPHDSRLITPEDYEYFKTVSSNKKVVAIGEIGLDYFYDLSPRETQKKVFVEQLELAASLKLPVILHLRDAYQDMLELLKQNGKYLLNGCLLHCYSGSPEMAKEYMKVADMYFAFGGGLTFKNAKNAIESLKAAPLDRIMFETDSPYLAPVPYRGKTNYPAYIKLAVEKASEILGIGIAELTEISTKNVKNLFKKIG